jgi:hypothetical protein
MNKNDYRPDKKRLKLIQKYDESQLYEEPFQIGETDISRIPQSRWDSSGLSGKMEEEKSRDFHFSGFGPKGYKRQDDKIYEDICEFLTKDRNIDATDITVKVHDGIVYLSGEIRDRMMKNNVEFLLSEISGVREIINDLNTIIGEEKSLGPDKITKKDLGIT